LSAKESPENRRDRRNRRDRKTNLVSDSPGLILPPRLSPCLSGGLDFLRSPIPAMTVLSAIPAIQPFYITPDL
jgi:hypothetical protein